MVFEVDLAKCGEDGGSDFENGCGDRVADYEVTLVVEGYGEGVVVDEGVAGGKTAGGRGDDGVEVCE